MIELNVHDECGQLEAVVVGLGTSPGGTPALHEIYDAKSYHSFTHGLYPADADLAREVEGLAQAIRSAGVQVYRPDEIDNCNQIFSRDVAFVIDNTLIKANIIEDRAAEMAAYNGIFAQIAPDKIVTPPDYVHVEGGDVLLYHDKIFVGSYLSPDYGHYKMARTNKYAIGFLKELFPSKEIIPLELIKHDTDPFTGVLHLDCCFQPIGGDKCIFYPGGFRHTEDWNYLLSLFGPDNTFVIDKQEMFEMNPNVFSLAPDLAVIDSSFSRLREWLHLKGVQTIEVPYRQVSRLGGLLRCTTMPLRRRY